MFMEGVALFYRGPVMVFKFLLIVRVKIISFHLFILNPSQGNLFFLAFSKKECFGKISNGRHLRCRTEVDVTTI